ncbi:MAG: S46 family peptidase [Bacteroidota bacterium]
MQAPLRIAALSLLLCISWTGREEGMWLPDAVGRLPLDRYAGRGLELTPDQIYRADGPSLKDAVVSLGGGTGAFISPRGLILTNHHVAYGAIQGLSSVESDYLRDGFLARTEEEELPTSLQADIVASLRDITPEVLSGLAEDMSPRERSAAVEERLRSIREAAPPREGISYRTSSLYGGNRFYLFGYHTLKDVRLVYAPPGAIGNFGGEEDNWMWPRHTGDFTILRAYAGRDGKPAPWGRENRPHTPHVFLPICSTGVSEGDFAMVMGFPGRTYRYRESAAVELARDETLPLSVELAGIRIGIIREAGRGDRAVEIRYASKLRGLANGYKKNSGTLELMRRLELTSLKRRQEDSLAAFLEAEPGGGDRTLLAELDSAAAGLRKVHRKHLFLTQLASGVELVGIARRIESFAGTWEGDSLDADARSREVARLADALGKTYRDLDLRVDRAILEALALRGSEPGAAEGVETLGRIAGTGEARVERVRAWAGRLYAGTMLRTPATCRELLGRDAEEIRRDPFLGFVRDLTAEQDPLEEAVAAHATRIEPLRRRYAAALLRWRGDAPAYPDANRTLRITYGRVEALAPRDAVALAPFTTLGGVVQKETGEEPFLVPPRLRELWRTKDFGPYASPTLGDVPVAFIASLDITNGNSGSPVLNGRGELIGCAFDGNWESLAGDYRFEENLARSINVDARYILFLLDKFSGAENILAELEIR